MRSVNQRIWLGKLLLLLGILTDAVGLILGRGLESVEDIKQHMEEIRIYLRGHNLFDIFYGKYREQEKELLERYIDLAPKEDFADIFAALERFPYFEGRRC